MALGQHWQWSEGGTLILSNRGGTEISGMTTVKDEVDEDVELDGESCVYFTKKDQD